MAIPNKLKRYGYHVVIAIDQLFNALTGGAADETLSSRTYRGAMLAMNPKKRWQMLYRVINGIFFDRNHCKTAYESELNRKQYPEGFKTNEF
ncbi:DNA helicase UvrD [Haemophilus haemolyticus]|uniref:DNA helicase UvrD n=1 Tax=Haemophilus haemolyticus TaxID=726 RepID=UPI000E579CC6|nr:DNA helicase UvrD [Haemophilus haemolyticus]